MLGGVELEQGFLFWGLDTLSEVDLVQLSKPRCDHSPLHEKSVGQQRRTNHI